MARHVLVVAGRLRFVATGSLDRALEIIRNKQTRRGLQELERADVGCNPVRQALCPGRLGVGLFGRSHDRYVDLRRADLTAARVKTTRGAPALVDKHLPPRSIPLAHRARQAVAKHPVERAELA